MKNQVFRFIKNEKGFAYTAMFLFLLPLILFLSISSTEIKRAERATNETLQQALSHAVNNAAHMVDKESQAMGQPHIDYERAFKTFADTLSYNLTLIDYQTAGDTADDASSITKDVTYWLLIYNGDDNFKGYKGGKVASYAYYTNEKGYDECFVDDSVIGFPKDIDISDSGFVKTDRSIQTAIERPSVIGIIQTNVKSITGKKGEDVSRWAKAEIIVKK